MPAPVEIAAYNTTTGTTCGIGYDGQFYYVADRTQNIVVKHDPANTWAMTNFIGLYGAQDICFDGTNICVLHYDNTGERFIKKYNLAGTLVSNLQLPKRDYRGLTWDGANFWVTEFDPVDVNQPKQIHKIDTNGTIIATFNISAFTTVGAIDWDGENLWIMVDNYFQKRNRAGTLISEFLHGYSDSYGCCWNGHQLLMTEDYGTAQIHIFKEAPKPPTVVHPNGGEAVDAVDTIEWINGGYDYLTEQPIYAEVQLSEDGVAWNTILAQSTDGAETLQYDFSGIAYTTAAKVRLKNINEDGDLSAYDTSDAAFTVGIAPLAPTNLSPSGIVINYTENQEISWINHDNDAITAFQLIIYQAGTDTVAHDTGETAGDGPYTLAENTIAGGDYQFKVRTKDTHGLWGPYSQRTAFTASTAPTVTITSPINTGTYDKGILTVAANYSDAENDALWKYRAVLKDNLGNTLEDSGEVISAVTPISHEFDYILSNNTAYSVEVTVWDDTGLQSTIATSSFTTNFVAPKKPVISAVAGSGKIMLNISNPVSVPAPDRNHIYKKIDGVWVRIAKDYAINTAYEDYAVVSGEVTEYQVVNVSETETTATSDSDSASTTFTGVWLHDVTDPAGTVHQFQYDGQGRDAEWQAEAVLMQFVGRTNPVAEFGEGENERVTATLQLFDATDYAEIQSLVKAKSTLCYRDGMGKKIFGVVTILPISDEKPSWHMTTITVQKTDYTEAV